MNNSIRSSESGHSVAIIMGSDSDWAVMSKAADALDIFGVSYHCEVVSAHRTPGKLFSFASSAAEQGFKVIIAGAGGAAHLPGMVASLTTVPVVGVPVALAKLDGLDSLLSIVQMPAGIPVATMAVDGAFNAGLFAVRVLATSQPQLVTALGDYQRSLASAVEDKNTALHNKISQRSR